MPGSHYVPVLLVLFISLNPLYSNGDFLGLQDRITALFDDNKLALVRVKAIYPPKENEEIPQVVIGTGFFISREGLILTNASIVLNPLRVWVEHEEIAFSAEVIGHDERSNIAFLRTHTLPDKFTFLHLVDSPELPKTGSFVLRFSMPLEFKASPSIGLVSGYESRFGERFFPCTYIRTSIPAGPGDGGSAFIDLSGRLLGIQVGSLPDVDSSYILPARAAMRIRDDVLFSGKVTYGWIGFEVEAQSSIEEGRMLVLSQVFDDSPAESTGFLPGDVLRQIGDYPITVLDDLRNAMFYTRVGQYVDVLIQRGEETRRFNVKMASRPENEPMQIIEPSPEPDFEPVNSQQGNPGNEKLPFTEDLNRALEKKEDNLKVPSDVLQPPDS